MDIWNVWTALVTGLVIGTSIGMLLTALLTISSRDEPRRSEPTGTKAESLDVSALHGHDSVAPPNSIDRSAEVS